jgi:hypothetical protein
MTGGVRRGALFRIRRHWDLLLSLATGLALAGFAPLGPDPTVRTVVAIAGALLAWRLARSLGLLLQLTLWLLDETLLRPCAWTIVGGLVGVLWMLDLVWRLREGQPSGRLVTAAVLVGYPAGALVALLPRGLVGGFGALRKQLAQHAPEADPPADPGGKPPTGRA